ncbi:FAD-dependent monooxygenase [Nocardia thailandica]
MTADETGLRQHAVVLGASMGGLLAARVLSQSFARVTVLERDDLSTPGDRRGVPQGRHVHALLARGTRNLEALFPGITAELRADGTVDVRALDEMRMTVSGHTLARSDGGYTLLQASRPLLEWRVRQRVRALANVEILDRHAVLGLLTGPDAATVTGVDADSPAGRISLSANLVVSCLGRHGPVGDWLDALGYERPAEEGVRIDMMYASRPLRLPVPPRDKEIIVANQDPARGLALFAIENGRHLLTLIGYGEDHPPTDTEGFWRFAASVAPPDVGRALLDAEPLGPISTYRYPANLRRRYERLDRFPRGLLVCGDAVCSFSPAFGQGMTISSVQALCLREALAGGDDDLARRFFAASAGAIDDAWLITRLFDLSMPHVGADRAQRAASGLARVAMAVGSRDALVSRRIARVAGLLDRPSALAGPAVVARALGACLAAGLDRVRPARDAGDVGFDPLPPGPARGFHALTVSSVTREGADRALVEFAIPPRLTDRFGFTAGQHVIIRGVVDGRTIRRSYSLYTAPGDGRVRIAVKRQPGGAFSGFAVDRLRAGTVLHVSEPTGGFGAPGIGRHLAAVAAGSGITPILSIAEDVLRTDPAATFTLHYGSRDEPGIMLAHRLSALAARFPDRLRVTHHLSRAAELPAATDGLGYRHGRLDPAAVAGVEADLWLLCGPEALSRAVADALAARGVPRDRVRVEFFDSRDPAPAAGPAAAPPARVTLTGYGDDLVFTMPADGYVLPAAVRLREDLPYSCLGGSCGTCLYTVEHGEVAMDPDPLSAISADDLAAGRVLACRTRPASAEVVLRFSPGPSAR